MSRKKNENFYILYYLEKNKLAELKIEAAVRGGEILIEMKKRGERRSEKDGAPKKALHDETLILTDLNISRIQAHRWQTMARLPKEERIEFFNKVKQKKAGYEENE